MSKNAAEQERTPSAQRRVKVMGTDAHVIVVADDDVARRADTAITRLQEFEARWSRFTPGSEISRLNSRRGAPVRVAPETFQLVEHALVAWRMTDGKFDPTILADLRAAGYDRSFELLGVPKPESPSDPPRRASNRRRASRSSAPDIELDRIVGTVRLGPNTTFDAGGIGKGFAADLVVEELLANGARGVLVNIGGDLRATGEAPEGGAWVVAVANPLDAGQVLGDVCIGAGAVASSWRTKRTWIGPDGREHHHLIDPRTGVSAVTGVAGVTVIASQGWRAEVLAKAAFLAGPDDGPELIARAGAAGIVFTDGGSARLAGNIEEFFRPAAPGADT